MQLFGSLWWDGGAGLFYGFKGGGLRSTALEHPFVQTGSGRSDKTQCRRAKSGRCLMLESVVRVAEAKDQEGQTTGVGHSRGM